MSSERMMTSRQRLRAAYFHEQMDRPGVYNRPGYARGDPSYDRLKAYVAEKTDLKARWCVDEDNSPYPTSCRVEPHSLDYQRRVTVMHTPAGDLESSHLQSLKGQPGMPETYLLKDRRDAEKYLLLPMPQPPAVDAASFVQAVARVGERGIVEVGIGTDPGGHVASLFGSEGFAMMTITDRDILHALCDRQMRIVIDRVKALLAAKVGPYFWTSGQELIVPPLHGPRDFDDFGTRYDKPIFDLIHDGGGRIHVHSEGKIRKVLDGFLAAGVDVLHPFEAPPMGDITPAEAKRLAAGRLTVEGNIHIADMYEKTPQEIREQTRRLIDGVFGDRRGLIVTPTASAYIRGGGQRCFPQYKAMIDTVLQYPSV